MYTYILELCAEMTPNPESVPSWAETATRTAPRSVKPTATVPASRSAATTAVVSPAWPLLRTPVWWSTRTTPSSRWTPTLRSLRSSVRTSSWMRETLPALMSVWAGTPTPTSTGDTTVGTSTHWGVDSDYCPEDPFRFEIHCFNN